MKRKIFWYLWVAFFGTQGIHKGELGPGEGGSQYKGLSGNVPMKWVAKSASWNDDPLFSAKTGVKMGHISQIF